MEEERPSKTRMKQAMHELQSLGVSLTELPAAQLASFDLPADLRQAISDAQRMTSHEARRRQIQLLGKLMRSVDPEPLRERLAALAGKSAATNAKHRRHEQWRERMMDDDAALTEFAQAFPHADLQIVRTLIRNARRELKDTRAPRAFRELFRVIRELDRD